jgi:hypothetical protein
VEQPKAHYNFLQATQEASSYPSTPVGGGALAASATKNGATYDCGNIGGLEPISVAALQVRFIGSAAPSYFRAFAAADVAGTLNVQQSPDGTNWFTTDTASIPASAGTGVRIEAAIVLRYVRAQVVNGSSPQTEFEFDTVAVSR